MKLPGGTFGNPSGNIFLFLGSLVGYLGRQLHVIQRIKLHSSPTSTPLIWLVCLRII